MTQRFQSGVVGLLFLVILFAGCQRGPTMYQVSGKVKFKDGSAPKAPVCLVNFIPLKDGKGEGRRNATGPIGPDGSFTMYTRVGGDGVFPGDYAVVFNVANNPMAPVSILDPKYTDASTPPYKLSVDRNLNDLVFTIEPLSGAAGGAAK
jgi:hypothetical protein